MKTTIPSAFTLVLASFFLFSPLAEAVSAAPAGKVNRSAWEKAGRSSKGRKSKVVPFKKGKRSSMALHFAKLNKVDRVKNHKW